MCSRHLLIISYLQRVVWLASKAGAVLHTFVDELKERSQTYNNSWSQNQAFRGQSSCLLLYCKKVSNRPESAKFMWEVFLVLSVHDRIDGLSVCTVHITPLTCTFIQLTIGTKHSYICFSVLENCTKTKQINILSLLLHSNCNL